MTNPNNENIAPRPDATATVDTEQLAPARPTRRRRLGRKSIWIASGAVALVAVGGVGAAVATDGFEQDENLTGASLERASKAALAETGGGQVTGAEGEDGGFEVEVRMPDGSEVDVLLGSDYAVLGTDRDDDAEGADDDRAEADHSAEAGGDSAEAGDGEASDGAAGDGGPGAAGSGAGAPAEAAPLTEDEITRASAAALASVGAGTVEEVERSDDATHAFEVQVRLPGGDEVDVKLDGDFAVVSSDTDPADRP
jgi:uncharacterized membrane protein YkoI